MTQWLKQSTAKNIILGPFVNDTDGVTAVTAFVASDADVARICKDGSTTLTPIASDNTWTNCSDATAFYTVGLVGTNVDTLGTLDVMIQDADLNLPVMGRFMVMPAHVFDGMVKDTDYLQVDAIQIGSVAANNLSSDDLSTDIAIGLATLNDISATDAALAVWESLSTDHTSAGSFGLNLDEQVSTRSSHAASDVAAGSGAASDVWAFATRNLTGLGFQLESSDLNVNMDQYYADIGFADDQTDTADLYTVIWKKNNEAITSGITSPTIQVIASSGSDLIASTDLSEVDSLGVYTYSETANKMAMGDAYFVKVQATIDSDTRTDWDVISPIGNVGALALIGTDNALTIADHVWDELSTDHTTAGTYGLNLDEQVSTRSSHNATDVSVTASVAASDIWDAATTDFVAAGTFGLNLDAQISAISTGAASDVWAFGTRGLSSNPSPASDVWGFATRGLSSNPSPASDVWGAVLTLAAYPSTNTAGWMMGSLTNTIVSSIGQAAGGTTDSITLAAAEVTDTDYFKGQTIAVFTGTGIGQARACYQYDSDRKAHIRPGWAIAPDTDSWYAMLNVGAAIVAAVDDGVLNDLAASDVQAELVTYDAATGTELAALNDIAASDVQAELVTYDAVVIGDLNNLAASDIQAELVTYDAVVIGDLENLSATDAGAAAWAEIMDTDITYQGVMRGMSAVLMGKSSGGGTTTDVFRDLEDGKDRITATVDSDGNRTAITLDLS